jgi:phage portal protein BeeE
LEIVNGIAGILMEKMSLVNKIDTNKCLKKSWVVLNNPALMHCIPLISSVLNSMSIKIKTHKPYSVSHNNQALHHFQKHL